MQKNLSFFLILIMFLGSVLVISPTATEIPVKNSGQIGGSENIILAVNFNNQENISERLLSPPNDILSAKADGVYQTNEAPKNQSPFTDTSIIILLGIGLFGIGTVRRRNFPDH
jgi:hypothetical protein